MTKLWRSFLGLQQIKAQEFETPLPDLYGGEVLGYRRGVSKSLHFGMEILILWALLGISQIDSVSAVPWCESEWIARR